MCADADNRGEEGEGGWEPNVPGQQGPGGSSELPERRWRGRQKGRGGAENLFKTGVEHDQDSGRKGGGAENRFEIGDGSPGGRQAHTPNDVGGKINTF